MTISDTGRPGFVWSGTEWVPILGAPSDGMFIGTITAWGGTTPPLGWQLCDGSAALSPALVALVGANVPDLRDRFIVGVSGTKAKGATGGAETVTLTTNQVPPHRHQVFLDNLGGAPGGQASIAGSSRAANWGTADPMEIIPTQAAGGQAHNNMPPYYALAWIIKHTGEAADGLSVAEGDARYLPGPWIPLALAGGLTAVAGHTWPPRYRLTPGGRSVEIDLMVNTAAAQGNGATLATLPVGYRPVLTCRYPGIGRIAAANNGPTFHDVRNDGAITVSSGSGSGGIEAGGSIRLACLVPLD